MADDIAHAVDIQADPGTIYRAVTTAEGIGSFWTTDNEVEGTVGGRLRFGFPAAPIPLTARVEELDEGKRVAWSCGDEWPYWGGTRISWELSPADGGGTRVLFRHGGWPADYPEGDRAAVNFVWGQVVGRLKGYAESGTPQPFFG